MNAPGAVGAGLPGEPMRLACRWQRRVLGALAEAGELAWSPDGQLPALLGPGGRGPNRRAARRFMRGLEWRGVVSWDPYRRVFWLTDREAAARILRWDAHRALTAAYRSQHVADAPRPDGTSPSSWAAARPGGSPP